MKSKPNFSGAFKEVEAYAKGKNLTLTKYTANYILLLHRYITINS